MIYFPGDRLKVKPLQDVCKTLRSNVTKSYIVTVVSDDKDRLVTYMEGGHQRTFDKNSFEWKEGHKFRFTKI